MNYTNTFFDSVLHLLYPRLCPGCASDVITAKQVICLECLNGLPLTDFFNHALNPVEKIFSGRLRLQCAGSYAYFTKESVMQNLLHELKYRGNKDVGYYFGQLMGETFITSGRFENISALVPLPLYFKREKKRGYNQAKVISDGIAEILKVPVLNNVIVRNSKTETQTHKNRSERWDNMEGRFKVMNEDTIAGKHLLLVDDVITTGATLEACGTELLRASGVQLSIASLAYTSL
jgi:ComF family protein